MTIGSRFHRQFRRAGVPNLLRQFGEPVTYYPGGEGDGREIIGMVERGTPEVIAETGDITSQAIIIRVQNSDCNGIASDEVNIGGDEIGLNLRSIDNTMSRRRSIVRVLNDSNGLTRILVQ